MSRARHNGQTLILILWTMGLLSAAMGALVVRSTHEMRLGRFPLAMVQERAIADAAVWQAAALLQQDDAAADHLQEAWATGLQPDTQTQLFVEAALGEGRFSVGQRTHEGLQPGLVDEQRKLHLNTAAVEHLASVIASVAPAGVSVQEVAAAIVDWRDEAVGEACASAVPACHNGPFETVEELRLAPGMTPELFEALQPYVTVYGNGAVNVNTASAVVLNAIGAPAETWIAQREAQPFTVSPEPGNPLVTVTSTHFTVPVEATVTATAHTTRLEAVIDREGHLLAWHPRDT